MEEKIRHIWKGIANFKVSVSYEIETVFNVAECLHLGVCCVLCFPQLNPLTFKIKELAVFCETEM